MDLNAISDELKSIDIQLRESILRERRALLTGYLEGVKAEQANSKLGIDKLKKRNEELEASLEKVNTDLKKVTEVA